MKLSRWKPVCGVYKITNKVNGKVYIGQSVNVLSRWALHVQDLVKGKHSNKSLQADFRQYKIKAFEVELIEKCKKDSLLRREGFYICQYRQQGIELYNLEIGMPFIYLNDDEKLLLGDYPDRRY